MSEADGQGRRRIAVAIATFRRPDSLAKLLSMVGERAAELPQGYETIAIVVDNDPDASARSVVTQDSCDVAVRYAHEPRPGIAAARSRLLREGTDQHLLVFIDDDEWPLPGWLSELVRTWEHTGAAAVAGRVETVLPPGTDPWVVAFGIFDRKHPEPEQGMPAAATNNLLLDMDQVRELGIDFDLSLGLRGGEDTLFTRQLVAGGGSIVFCPTSVVRDDLEPERATRGFTTRRARFHGITQADIDLRLAGSPFRRLVSRLRSTAKGVVWVTVGVLRGVRGRLGSSLNDEAWSVRHVQRGIGLVYGAWGRPPGEYARVETSGPSKR